MRILVTTLVATALLQPAAIQPLVRTFEEDPAGAAPAGFAFTAARGAAPDRWATRREAGNMILVYEGRAEDRAGMAVAALQGLRYFSPGLSVRLRLIGGSRSAGLVWWYEDDANYHFARLDLGSQSLALYRVVNGNRIRLEDEDDLELDPDAWYTLAVRQDRERIRVYVGGIKVFEEASRERPPASAIGVWSAGDSVSWFDDLRVVERGEERHAGTRR